MNKIILTLVLIFVSSISFAQTNTTTIPGLPQATTPLSGSEFIPLSQNGVTRHVTASQLTSQAGGTVKNISCAAGSTGLSCSVASPTLSPVITLNGSLNLNSIASIGSNTILGSAIGGSPTALSIPSCSSSSSALIWTAGSGFGCNSISSTTGTVTSVGMTMDGVVFNSSVGGSPVTSSGTFAPTLKTVGKNLFLAGPVTGSNALWSARAIAGEDLPLPTVSKLGGVMAKPFASNSYINSINLDGSVGQSQPSFTEISGTLNLATQVSGVLKVPNGGTGLSSPGTNGNCLISNGSTWTSLPCGGGGSPGGNQYDVQLNNGSGGFSGSDNLNFNTFLNIVSDSSYGQIGVSDPNTAIYGGLGINGSNGQIIANTAAGDFSIWNTGGSINFSTDSGSTNMMNLNSSGELGIGTSLPVFSLQIQGNGVYTGYTGTTGAIALQNASIPAKLMYEGFDPNLGSVGGGYIQSVYSGNAYEPTFLSPAGGGISIGSTKISAGTILDLSGSNSSFLLPIGTTGTRPATGINGMLRYNSAGSVEGYINNSWISFSTSSGTVTTTGTPASGNLTKFSGSSSITNGDLSGDVSTSGALVTTVAKVNGVAYGTSPSTNTVPVVTGTNAITYETVPNAALANSAITFGATSQALGSTVTNLNAVNIGPSTAGTGAFTALSASSTVSGTGFSTYLASPPAIGGTVAAAGSFTIMDATTSIGVGSSSPKTSFDDSQKTDAIILPIGTTLARPATGVNGMLRYSSSNNNLEAYQNNAWTALSTTSGTVTAVSIATANGFSGSSSGGATPALTIVAGAITPSSVAIGGSIGTDNFEVTGTSTFNGAVALGANSLTMTGSLGATGARLTKGWFTDLQATNAISGSITGNAATVTTNANLTGPVTSSGNATTVAYVQGAVAVGTTSAASSGTILDLGNSANASLALLLPSGTTGQRPTGINGMIRYNSTATPTVEAYVNNAWTSLASSTGTVTSIATTAPISGGTITTTGTLSCPTCVTSAAALTANALVIGGGLQASSALGSLGTTTTVLHGNVSGAPTFGAVVLTTDVSGNLPNANLASQTANTVLGALTATTPSGLSVPSCSTASSALTWTSGTGFGCNTISGSGTVASSSIGQVPVYTGATTVTGNANFTYAAGAISLGAVSTQGSLKLLGTTSGTLTITTQAAAGTPTWTAGTSSGTPVVTASSPLAITTATGNATCATCATTTNGGALSGTAPIAVSAAGVISGGGLGTVTGALKGNGSGTITQAACADLSNGATGCSTATGTSGATLPLLNGANTWSGVQSFNASDLSAANVIVTSSTIPTNGLYLPSSNIAGISANSQPVAQFSGIASAVDYLTLTNAATANPASVSIASAGTDTNINLNITPKGSGGVGIGTASPGAPVHIFAGNGRAMVLQTSGTFSTGGFSYLAFRDSTGSDVYQVGPTGFNNDFNIDTLGAQSISMYVNNSTLGLRITSAGSVQMPNLSSTSSAQTGTVCWTTSTGNLTVDTSTTCLLSSLRFKKDVRPMHSSLADIMKMKPITFVYKDKAMGTDRLSGLIAEDLAPIDKTLVEFDHEGLPYKIRYEGLTAKNTKAIQELEDEIEDMHDVHGISGHKCFFGLLLCPN